MFDPPTWAPRFLLLCLIYLRQDFGITLRNQDNMLKVS